MFLEDEFAMMRPRAIHRSLSLPIMFVAFAAVSLPTTFGLVRTACAAEAEHNIGQFDRLVRPNDINSGSFLLPATGELPEAKPADRAMTIPQQELASMKLPQTATRADEEIMRGLTALLLAMTAASGLAVWRRRVRGVFAGAVRNDH